MAANQLLARDCGANDRRGHEGKVATSPRCDVLKRATCAAENTRYTCGPAAHRPARKPVHCQYGPHLAAEARHSTASRAKTQRDAMLGRGGDTLF